MKKAVTLEFSEPREKVGIELDDSQLPKTVRAIICSLPIRVAIKRWGDESYARPWPDHAAGYDLPFYHV